MKVKNNKGFTLIEMLVVIAIIASLSVAIGVSSNSMLKSSETTQNQETYKDIFKDARIYSEMKCSLKQKYNSCEITLYNLVDSGLTDEKIFNENNPALKEDASGNKQKFKETDKIVVAIDGNGYKTISMTTGSCTINENNLGSIMWGEC